MNGKHFRSGRRMVVLALVVVLCLGTVCGFATGYITIGDGLKSFLGIENDDSVAGMGGALNVSLESGGWTVDFKEVLGDSQSVYILYDVTAPFGTVLDENTSFADQRIELPLGFGSGGGGWYSENLPDDNPSDNIQSYVLCVDCSKNLDGKTLGVDFGEMSTYKYDPVKDEGETVLLSDARFSAELELNYTVSSVKKRVHSDFVFLSSQVTLTDFELSPLSLILNFKGGVFGNDRQPEGYICQTADNEPEIMLHMADGTTYNSFRGSSSNSHNGLHTEIYAFDKVIDINNVVAITMCGEYIEL